MTAAERLFADKRFHEVTLDDVAAASKVGKGTIYRYFNDKDDLFFQTATSGFDGLCALLERHVPPEGPFRERLMAACVEITEFFRRRRPLLRMMLAEEGRLLSKGKGALKKRWLENRSTLVSAVARILDQGAAQGALRNDIPADMLALYLLGMLRTRARETGAMDSRTRSLEMLLDLFLCGARERKGSEAAGGIT